MKLFLKLKWVAIALVVMVAITMFARPVADMATRLVYRPPAPPSEPVVIRTPPDTIVQWKERIVYVEKQADAVEVRKGVAKAEVQEFCMAAAEAPDTVVRTDTVVLAGPPPVVTTGAPTFITAGRLDGRTLELYGINAMGDSIAATYSGIHTPVQFARRPGGFFVQSNRWGPTKVWLRRGGLVLLVAGSFYLGATTN